jgi:hypothetical protein
LILSSGEDSLSLDKFILSKETTLFLPISWNSLIQLNAVQGTSLVFSVVKTWRSAKFSESGGILVKANSISGSTKLLEVFTPTLKHGNSGPPKPRPKNKRGEIRIKIAKETRTPRPSSPGGGPGQKILRNRFYFFSNCSRWRMVR